MPPTKLAHVVFQTNQIGWMRDRGCSAPITSSRWYAGAVS